MEKAEHTLKDFIIKASANENNLQYMSNPDITKLVKRLIFTMK